VTVLFVDIRGYATFAEGKRPETIFSMINQYTETVSAIVREQGGNIVEFNGDGMMTVFGAPEPLPEKEQSAVVAARQIVAGVARLSVEGEPGALSAGVGIATGPAFVGSIRSVDRLIWSAIGNTTNLASRLQSLTRELEAAIVIDSRTYRGARPSCAGFELHARRAIRGRKEPEDIYVLPLYRATASQELPGQDFRRPSP
jgi:class 3 adenylate cyclase